MNKEKNHTPSKADKGIETPKAPQNQVAQETEKSTIERVSSALVASLSILVSKIIANQWEIGKVVFNTFKTEGWEGKGFADERKAVLSEVETTFGKTMSATFIGNCTAVYRVFWKETRSKGEIAKPEYVKNWTCLVELARSAERIEKKQPDNTLPVYTWAGFIGRRSLSQVKDMLAIAEKGQMDLCDPQSIWDNYLANEKSILADKQKKQEEREAKAKATLAARMRGEIDNTPNMGNEEEKDSKSTVADDSTLSKVLSACLSALGINKVDVASALQGNSNKALVACQAIAKADEEHSSIVDTARKANEQLHITNKALQAERSSLRFALDHVVDTTKGLDLSHLDNAAAVEAAYLIVKVAEEVKAEGTEGTELNLVSVNGN